MLEIQVHLITGSPTTIYV